MVDNLPQIRWTCTNLQPQFQFRQNGGKIIIQNRTNSLNFGQFGRYYALFDVQFIDAVSKIRIAEFAAMSKALIFPIVAIWQDRKFSNLGIQS